MDTSHDTPAHHDGLVFIEPAATAPVTADERDTRQTAVATLLRSRVATGRPLCAPPAPGETTGPLDPAAPGIDDRVRAILDRPTRAAVPDERGPIA